MTQFIKQFCGQFSICIDCIVNINKKYLSMLLKRPLLRVIIIRSDIISFLFYII